MVRSIPESYKVIDNKYLYYRRSDDSEIYVCNFIPYVNSAIKATIHNSTDNIEIKLALSVNGELVDINKYFTLSEIKSTDWESIDYRCSYNMELPNSQIKRHLYSIVQFQLANNDLIHELPKYEHTGWVIYKEQHAYLAGDTLITAQGIVPRNNYLLDDALKDYKLEINFCLDYCSITRYMLHLIEIEPGITDVLVANLIVSLLRPFFKDAGIIPSYTCYLIGKSQTRKTTIASHSSIIYNRSSNDGKCLINLLSSSAAVHRSLSAINDACFIVDDLYKSERTQDMHSREERLSEVIRTVGNNSAKAIATRQGSASNAPNCNIICTAEYLLKGISTLSRCLVLYIDYPIPSAPLYESQKDPLALSTFVYYFLEWCCKYYGFIEKDIKSKWDNFRVKRTRRVRKMERLYETKFLMQTAMGILGDFFETVGEMDYGFKSFLIQGLKSSLNALIRRQQEEILRISRSNDDDKYTKFIAALYFGNFLDLEEKKKNVSEKSQGIVHKNILCLTPAYILTKCMEHFREPDITINKITAELRRNGLIIMDSSNKSTKKINGIRLLHIPLEKLESYYEDAMDDASFVPKKSVLANADPNMFNKITNTNDAVVSRGESIMNSLEEGKMPPYILNNNKILKEKLKYANDTNHK